MKKLSRFEFQNIPRSQINPAPYNPRTMDQGARKKLRESLKRWGLVEPLVWNRRTGHLVGGHQRLAEMDRLVGYPDKTPDYEVPCAVVDLDEVEEKQLNVALNNPNLQGEYDWSALESLFREGVNPFVAGFDPMDLAVVLGEETAQEIAALYGLALDGDPLMGDVESLADEAQKIEAIKARKREYEAEQREDIPENYLMVIYASAAAKAEALRAWGLPPDLRAISAERWAAIIEEFARSVAQEVKREDA